MHKEQCLLLDWNQDGLNGAIDIQMINSCFLKSNQKGSLENALLLASCLTAAARGGEARLLNWEEAIWDTSGVA